MSKLEMVLATELFVARPALRVFLLRYATQTKFDFARLVGLHDVG